MSPSADQLASLVRTMRAGDRASAPGRGGVRTDGSRENNAATIALLATAARDNSSVNIGYVDAQGSRRIASSTPSAWAADSWTPSTPRAARFAVSRCTELLPSAPSTPEKVAKKKQLAFFCK